MPWWSWILTGYLFSNLVFILSLAQAAGESDDWMEKWYENHQRNNWHSAIPPKVADINYPSSTPPPTQHHP